MSNYHTRTAFALLLLGMNAIVALAGEKVPT